MLGPRAATRLSEVDECRRSNQQNKQNHLKNHQQPALQGRKPVGALEGISPVQEEHSRQNAAHKTD